MRRIFKYQLLTIDGPQPVDLPEDAHVLTFQYQPGLREGDGSLNIWAVVDDAKPRVTRGFVVVGTGHRLPDGVGMQTWDRHRATAALRLALFRGRAVTFVLFTKHDGAEILVNTDLVFAVEKRNEDQCWLRFAVAVGNVEARAGNDHAPYHEAVLGTLTDVVNILRGRMGFTTFPGGAVTDVPT